MNAKILILDIETAPKEAFVWNVWKANIPNVMLERDGYVLCVCAKWLGSDETMSVSLPEGDDYVNNPEDDSYVVETVWKWLEEADMIVAHNARKFDIAVLNTRFAFHHMPPPRPFAIIDTLEIAKRRFKFAHNSLDALGEFLGLGRKTKHEGFELWAKCMKEDMVAFTDMINYCINDVDLLEKVYIELRPWMSTHPNVALFEHDGEKHCNICGSANLTEDVEFYHTKVFPYQMYRCECGGWVRSRRNCADKTENLNVMSLCQ
jgi:hypothetical protein